MTDKYKITIKRDFGPHGYWNPETRRNEKTGFVVVKGHCNCIPGAGWFKTIPEAMDGIRAHMIAGDTMAFHAEYKRIRAGAA
jgi:hypothetical protein